eukprot:m.64366 g.64366  ORF g.64366 m.64366 type:complete len:612 (+) comp11644_c0_seq2:132-1967(+)
MSSHTNQFRGRSGGRSQGRGGGRYRRGGRSNNTNPKRKLEEGHDDFDMDHSRGSQRGGRGFRGRGSDSRGGRKHLVLEPKPKPAPAAAAQSAKSFTSRTTSTTLSQITGEDFASLNVDKRIKQAIVEGMGYQKMTKVQAESIPVCLTGKSLLAKAKTGTGKTLAFLVPSLHRILDNSKKGKISICVISPTRELAQQIEEEAEKLLEPFGNTLKTGCIVGGIKMSKDNAMLRNPPDILVATPGRLNDHLANGSLRALMSNLKVLIFDEADRLLDMGFRPEIQRILENLPGRDTRQTLMFSATMPEDVQYIAKVAMPGKYEYVDTVGEEENTHQHVQQNVLVCPMDQCTTELICCIDEAQNVQDYKIIVFFTTARLTQFYAELFNAMGYPTLEMHSRKNQSQREKVAEQFRNKSSVMMFSSDVSARGMDYPGVSTVIQVSAPSDRAQYIHRLGRTARAGQQGSGYLLLCDFEQYFLKDIQDLPTTERKLSRDKEMIAEATQKTRIGLSKIPRHSFTLAYQAWLGYYNSNLRKLKWSKEDLVYTANLWICSVMGYGEEPPRLLAKTVGKMGLRGIPGLLVEQGGGGRGGGGRGGGGRGGGRGRGRGGRGQGGRR